MRLASMMLLALSGMVLFGCVAQADYDQLKLDNMTLASEKESFAQRTLDSESQANALRRQLAMKENELEVQKQLTGNLKSENDRLASAVDSAEALLGRIDFDPDKPLVIQTVLPPELDMALKNFAASHPNAVEYDPTRGVVKWKSDLLFSSGSDIIREDAKSTLRGFADVINTIDATEFDIIVVGHTDTDPIRHARAKGHPTNWHLSSHRSIAVGMELLSFQVNPERLGVMGYGEYRPVVGNATQTEKALNRRVEIFLVGHASMAMNTINIATDPPAAMREPQK